MRNFAENSTPAALPTNLWSVSHRDTCRECNDEYRFAPLVPVDLRGLCESCAANTYCTLEGCSNLAHVLSENQQCSRCELAGAIQSGDEERAAKWVPLVAADRTLHVDTPLGPVPQDVYAWAGSKAAMASLIGEAA